MNAQGVVLVLTSVSLLGLIKPVEAANMSGATAERQRREVAKPYIPPMPNPKPPTQQELVESCSTEIGIFCSANTNTLKAAKACLALRVNVVRKSCRNVLGLKRG